VVKQCVETHAGDYRIQILHAPNLAMSLGADDVWGYDPAIPRRYAQVMALTQGVNPDEIIQEQDLSQDHPLLHMFRRRFSFDRVKGRTTVQEYTNLLPHVLLVPHCQVLPVRNQIFSALTNRSFNPRETVILESPPNPPPAAAADPGTASVIAATTDSLTIEAEVRSPAILLITDTYAKGWRARPLPGSAQTNYDVMPANYCLRAIPLAAGKHRLRLEYVPAGFLPGKWVSLVSLALFLGLLGWQWSRQRHGRRAAVPPRPMEGA